MKALRNKPKNRGVFCERNVEKVGKFKKEMRYYVFKIKDIDNLCHAQEFKEQFELIGSLLPTRQYVVIESDWPEYENVWKMIQDRVEGKSDV